MGLFASIIKSFSPQKRKRKRKRSRKNAVRAGDGIQPVDAGNVKILVADLFGAGGADVADRVAGMLTQENALTTMRLKRPLHQNPRLGAVERLLVAGTEGAVVLAEEECQVLIWGEMEDMGTVARLRFISNNGADGQAVVFGIGDTLDLPRPMPDGAGDVVRAVAAAIALPIAGGARRELLDRLRKHLTAADKALEALPADVHTENRIAITSAIGIAHATAFRFGAKKNLPAALKNFEAASALANAEAQPGAWAIVQTHLGAALEADAKLRKDPLAMMAAIERYKTVSDGLGRDQYGYDWALANMRRALALYKLASMVPEKTTTHLKDAVSAFEEALTVYDRNVMPDRWADVMSHLGVAQMALGGFGANNAMLQQSVSTFRKVMEIRKRETVPLLWAQMANNLGAACFALAKRTEDEHLLEEAARNFERAIIVFREVRGYKKRAAVISNNLQRVRHMLEDAAA